MGLANYYSQYVQGYAGLAAPLMDLLQVGKEAGKKGSTVPVKWNPGAQQAFEKVKEALLQSLELFHLEPDKPFRMRTDASDYAVGGVLEQERQGHWVPVCFFSKKISG